MKSVVIFTLVIILIIISLSSVHNVNAQNVPSISYQNSWGQYGCYANALSNQFCILGVSGLAYDNFDSTVVVTDYSNGNFQVFDSSGNPQSIFNPSTCPIHPLNKPTGVAVDPSDGSIYVASDGDNNIKKYSHGLWFPFWCSNGDYHFQTEWGSKGTGKGQFNGPSGIAVDSNGLVWVVDSGNNRVEVFNSNGQYEFEQDKPGTGSYGFNDPQGITIDPEGDVFVTDTGNNRIENIFSSKIIHPVTAWGSEGTGDGQFNKPVAVATDALYVYVADAENHRVQVFDHHGVFKEKWGYAGTGPAQFAERDLLGIPFVLGPASIASSNWNSCFREEGVFVGDGGNFRIQAYSIPVTGNSCGVVPPVGCLDPNHIGCARQQISVAINNSTFSPNSIIIVNGHVLNPYPGQGVAVQVTNPSGKVVFATQLPLDKNGDYSTKIKTTILTILENGQYTIHVQQGDVRGSANQVQFKIAG